MTFDEYQIKALETATYPDLGHNIVYPAMGLAGEAGEVLDKIKKHWRNTNSIVQELRETLTVQQVQAIVRELGDVLWYINAMAKELGSSLEEVATINLEKLYDRRDRGVIKSEGDNR